MSTPTPLPATVKDMLSHIPSGPLNGVLVVAFDQQIAGSQASEELARDGATVIKVERKEGGDAKRTNSSIDSFGTFNAGKFSVTFDDTPEDQARKRELLARADVVVDNRSGKAQSRDTILQEALAQKRKKPLIYCAISGFGRDVERPAYDPVVQAVSGMAAMNGRMIPFPLIDMSTGNEAAAQIVKHLFHRNNMTPEAIERTPCIRLDVSMVNVAQKLMANQMTTLINTGKAESTIVPFGMFHAKDGRIALAVAKNDQFAKLCDALGREDLKQFNTNALRIANKPALEAALNEALGQKNVGEWLKQFDKLDIPAGPVMEPEEALNRYGRDIIKATKGGNLYVGSATTNNVFPRNPSITNAPGHGEHNSQVQDFIEALHQQPGGHHAMLEQSRDVPQAQFRNQYQFVDLHDVNFARPERNPDWAKGTVFALRKVGNIKARPAEAFERVDILHHEHVVSKIVAMKGDWVVTTSFGDQYVLPEKRFKHNYVPVEGEEGSFKPNPELAPKRALKATKNICFMSPSNDISYIPAGGWIVQGCTSTYGIHPDNIRDNYEVARWIGRENQRNGLPWASVSRLSNEEFAARRR